MKKLIVLLIVFMMVIFQFCTSHKKLAKSNNSSTISYTGTIQPIIAASCSPCHFPSKGSKKPLDSYDAVKSNIDEIIARVQRNPGERGFMPAMHPKLSDSTIQVLLQWKNQGLAEK